jgi:hypothetical protein
MEGFVFPLQIKMEKSNAGVFIATLNLYPGRYEVSGVILLEQLDRLSPPPFHRLLFLVLSFFLGCLVLYDG